MHIHRERWALTQEELARLIGKRSHSIISRYEHGKGLPPLRALLAYEVVFGFGLRQLVPELYGEVEEEVIARASELWSELEGRADHPANRKRALLKAMIDRATPHAAGA